MLPPTWASSGAGTQTRVPSVSTSCAQEPRSITVHREAEKTGQREAKWEERGAEGDSLSTCVCVCTGVFVHMGLRWESSGDPYIHPLCTPQRFGGSLPFPSMPPFSLALGCRQLVEPLVPQEGQVRGRKAAGGPGRAHRLPAAAAGPLCADQTRSGDLALAVGRGVRASSC